MSGETIIPFGKHKGEMVMDIERPYLEWLLEQEWLNPKLEKAITEHLERRDRSGDDF
jgi:uncharacterized protein (DUF3820 family)